MKGALEGSILEGLEKKILRRGPATRQIENKVKEQKHLRLFRCVKSLNAHWHHDISAVVVLSRQRPQLRGALSIFELK